nr:hypothetical protein [Desulforamulus aquiferis]
MSTGKMIARAALVVAVINLLSRILGFVRELPLPICLVPLPSPMPMWWPLISQMRFLL